MAKPIIAYGDSNMVGHLLASPSTTSFISITAATRGVGKTLLADLGRMMADVSFEYLYGTTPSEENDYVSMLGTNDADYYGSSAIKRAAAIRFYRNILIWNLCADKKFPRISGVTTSGTWTDTPINSIGKTTSSAGAYAEATVSGESVYVSYYIHSEIADVFEVYVDGVLKATETVDGASIGDTLIGRGYAPGCLRISGLSSGSHTVRVTHVSGTTFLEFIAGSRQSRHPRFFVADIPYRGAGAYSAGNSDANTDAYNDAIADMVAELVSDRHRVYGIDHAGFFDATTDYAGTDGIHPGIPGHAALAASYLARMGEVDLIPQFNAGSPFGRCSMSFIGNPVQSIVNH